MILAILQFDSSIIEHQESRLLNDSMGSFRCLLGKHTLTDRRAAQQAFDSVVTQLLSTKSLSKHSVDSVDSVLTQTRFGETVLISDQ